MRFMIDGTTTSSTQVASLNRVVYLSFTVNVPLESNCYVRVTFPEQVKIDIDETLLAYEGTGFMNALVSISTNAAVTKRQYASDGTGNYIIFPSCLVASELGKRA